MLRSAAFFMEKLCCTEEMTLEKTPRAIIVIGNSGAQTPPGGAEGESGPGPNKKEGTQS